MMFGGSFCQVLLCVLAMFRSPPIPLIAGVRPGDMSVHAGSGRLVNYSAEEPFRKVKALKE